MQLCVLLSALPVAIVTAAAFEEAGRSQRDASDGRLLTSRARTSAQVFAEAWLQTHSSVNQMPDELDELKGKNPEAYAIVQALLAKRSLGLLKLRTPSHSFVGAPPAQDAKPPTLIPAAAVDTAMSVSKPPPQLLHAVEKESPRVSRVETPGPVSWGNPFSFAPGTHVASETGGKPTSKWVTVEKLYNTLPESQHDVLASFHWDDAAKPMGASMPPPVSTSQQPPAQQPPAHRDHLSSWLHHTSEAVQTAGMESTRSPLDRMQGSAQTGLSVVRQSTQKHEYMDMLGPIDDSQPQAPDMDTAAEDSTPPRAPAANSHERFPLESFSWDDNANPVQKHALSSLSAQSQLHHAASPSKKTMPHAAAVEKSAKTRKVKLQSRKQPVAPSSPDEANPYLKGLDLGVPVAVKPTLPKENPYLAVLS